MVMLLSSGCSTYRQRVRLITALFLASGLLAAKAQVASTTYTFNHFVGPTGTSGAVDATGTSARFLQPSGIVADRFGTLFVADTFSGTIRRVLPSGAVTTLAGSAGLMGNSDGSGAAARFDHPGALALDSSGTLYVADTNNNSIRRITSTGAVTTIAGSSEAGSANGSSTAARFFRPSGIAVDNTGNVYVADTFNHTIRKIDLFGAVTTLAGTPGTAGSADGAGAAARFSRPTGITVDDVGQLYVTDSGNNTIRSITSSGVVTTFAGVAGQAGTANGAASQARFTRPTGIAVDTDGFVYVTDGTSTIRRISSTGVTTTVAGTPDELGNINGSGAAARFYTPRALAVNNSGSVFIADTNNDSIRVLTAAGAVTTLAGSPAPASVDAVGTSARFSFPTSVAVDRNGNVHVTDLLNHTIRRITSLGIVTTYAGTPGLPGSANGIGRAARFSSPSAIAVDSDGSLYVADTGNHTIRKISVVGNVSTLAGTAGLAGSANGAGATARFDRPSGIAVDSAGNVYVSDTYNHTIRKITSTGVVTTLAGTAGLFGQVDGSGSAVRFNFPGALAVDTSLNVYVADQDRVIRKITPNGVVTTLAGSSTKGSTDGTGTSARFDQPAGLALDVAGNLLVADSNNSTIRQITPAGVVTTIGGSAGQIGSINGPGSIARFNRPFGIAVDTTGTLYIADTYNNAVRRGAPDSSSTPTITTQPTNQTAVVGGRAAFIVKSVNGSSFQWTKDGAAIPGATSATFVIPNVQTSDAGSYAVTITSSGGSVQSSSVTLTVAPFAGVRLVNISTRSYVGAGGDVMIAGFIIGGNAPKTVLIRASGPALAQFGLSGLLADPTLALDQSGTVIATNDNWGDNAADKVAIDQAVLTSGAFAWTEGSTDAAIVTTLNPGPYTAIVAGKNSSTGLALIEVFEMDLANGDSKLINISTRSVVRTGADVQIAGFIISGTDSKKVIIRASGPALMKFSVPGFLADPVLELHNPTAIMATNDDWPASVQADFQSIGIDNWDLGSKDAAIVTTLNPGGYTAIVRGQGNTSGVALVEVFEAAE